MALHRKLRFQQLERRQLFAGDLAFSESGSDETSGVRAAEVRIQFDPEKVMPAPTDFLPGPAWQGKGAIVANVDPSQGTVTAFLFSVEPIDATKGELIDIRLAPASDAVEPVGPAFAIESITVDEGQRLLDPVEHRIDPVTSEEIKRQVQSRTDIELTPTPDPALELPIAAPENPAVEPALESVTPAGEHSPVSTHSDELHANDFELVYGPVPPACLWDAYFTNAAEAREPSRYSLLEGVRDDWSELDRLGHRKA